MQAAMFTWKKVFFVTLLPLLFFNVPAYADANLDNPSDLIQQAENNDEGDLNQVRVDNGNNPDGIQLSEQERSVYQHAQDQYEEERDVLQNGTKHEDKTGIISPGTEKAFSQAEPEDLDKYREQAQNNERLTEETN